LEKRNGPYTRTQIIVAGRPAACEFCDGAVPYHYDGINFWLTLGERSFLEDATKAPAGGWRHWQTCNCPLCCGPATG